MNPLVLLLAVGSGVAAVTAGVIVYGDQLGFGDKAKEVNPPVAALTAPVAPPKEAAPVEKTETPSVKTEAVVEPEKEAPVAQAKPEATAPSFDVVRVEPDGQTLVAGKATPGWTVELKAGDAVISSAVANATGDWVMVVEKTLNKGVSDLSLSAVSEDSSETLVSKSNVAVLVPEDSKGDGVVLETAPGQASKVLGRLGEPEAKVEKAPIEVADVAETVVEKVEEVVSAPEVVEPVAKVEESTPDVAEVVAPAKADPPKPVVEATPPAEVVEEKAEPAEAKAVEPAKAPEKKPEPAVAMTISIEAVEIEGDVLFVAGAAEPAGSAVRLYVDNKAVSDSKSGETGRFLFDGKLSLKDGSHQARVDLLDPKTGTVATRAEVSFSKKSVPVQAVTAEASVKDETQGQVAATAVSDEVKLKKVIIRRGDNLWEIARRVYGAGIRFSTIYDNNAEQIRNPHWIYPGQVFELPQGEADWDTNFDAIEAVSDTESSAETSEAVTQ